MGNIFVSLHFEKVNILVLFIIQNIKPCRKKLQAGVEVDMKK